MILWPKNHLNKIRSLNFSEDEVNVIHGRSRTGKSSIIAIIDYCLGSEKCTIPVGPIRDKTEWFGLKVRIRDAWVLIGRRTPSSSTGSGEFFFLPWSAGDKSIPETVKATHTHARYKDAFNKVARITNMSLVEDEDAIQSENPPSYRDMAAFNFLPQHIVANPNALFYKADTYQHKEKLKRVLPYALGIVDAEYLRKSRERTRYLKLLDSLKKELHSREAAFASWGAEVTVLWNESVTLGLVEENNDSALEARISSLRNLNDAYLEGRLSDRLRTPQYGFTNRLFQEATEAEEALQIKVDDLVQELRDYRGLAHRAKRLSKAVKDEKDRVVNLGWLQEKLVQDETCVVCGSANGHTHEVLSDLAEKLGDVTRLSNALREGPIVDKQLESLENELGVAQQKLHIARMHRLSLVEKGTMPMESLGRAYLLLGRLQALLMALATLDGQGDLNERIRQAEIDLFKVGNYFLNSGRGGREKLIATKLDKYISGYAQWLGIESAATIELDYEELTLSFSSGKSYRKDFLWEIGSGANWMAYHLSTFLALHEIFVEPERIDGPVFSFLAVDQPSQVYFPSTQSGGNLLDAHDKQAISLKGSRDNDIYDTRRIFRLLARGLERTGFKVQIIVVEHADKSIWGEVAHMNEVAAWKEEGDGLIPKEWF